ncbi:EAL domain-containing protein [Pseudomonas prosekii]|uniref:bifunctional diguanylate cyclase/phosphodiesterase n=1 Tax=Pseudomonas prosekii TaxID=1148509 RepID=UPI0021CCF84F|nr:EAL domain-containing protein [Pseudomonas prosekii]
MTRASLFKFVGLLACVFLLACYLLVYIASDLDRSEQEDRAFHVEKALKSLEAALTGSIKDYAILNNPLEYKLAEKDIGWSHSLEKIGLELHRTLGVQGLFVLNGQNQTIYSAVNGELKSVQAERWANHSLRPFLNEARAGTETSTPTSVFINIKGIPALVAAVATGQTRTHSPSSIESSSPSLFLAVVMLDEVKLRKMAEDYDIVGLRVATSDAHHEASIFPLGNNGEAGILQWDLPKPGRNLLELGLPLLGISALLIFLMTWVIMRRATAAAHALDDSYIFLQNAQVALAASEERFRDVVEASSDWVWEIDAEWRFKYLSERFEVVTGLHRNAWLGAVIDDLLRTTEPGMLSTKLCSPRRRHDLNLQCSYVDATGQIRITRISAREMTDGGFRGAATDITEEVEARRRIEFLSQHDAMTGLPNRIRLQEFLDGKLKALPTDDRPLVMISLDLDRFKPVNDMFGHAAGDSVLNEVSIRLAACVRQDDLVARIGGDEFVLILTDLTCQDEVESLCERLIKSIERPIKISSHEIFISASIGIAMAPNDAREATELLRYADIALYEAKAHGRNTWRFYAGDMNAKLIERRRLEIDLRHAITNGELQLQFQPRSRIVDGNMVGAEALVRWLHPERGLILPDAFIPIAEDAGMILTLSDWVLETACFHAKSWPDNLFVSVNLSPAEFKQGNLIERVQKVLADSGIKPHRLELEITESLMLEDVEGVLDVMHALKRSGVRISMDDFGIGYSSLSHLRTFPFDGMKIDRSFLNKMSEDEDHRALIQAMVGIGHALALTVTAEGIETSEQLDLLKSVSCDEGQGYYLSLPLDIDEFADLVASTFRPMH